MELGEKVKETEKVDERSRSRVHENQGKNNDVHRVHIPVPESVISTVLAVVTHTLVLLVSETALKNLWKQVSHLEKSSKYCESHLVQNIPIVEETIWVFVNQPEQLNKPPASSQDVH